MVNAFYRGVFCTWLVLLIPFSASASIAITGSNASKLRVSMMRGSMMGPGMFGSSTNSGKSESNARPLEAYISNQRLTCFSCHSVSRSSIGPSFDEIAHRYADDPNAGKILASSITQGVSGKWPNYGGMPGGLANHGQAQKLAHLIMELSGIQ